MLVDRLAIQQVMYQLMKAVPHTEFVQAGFSKDANPVGKVATSGKGCTSTTTGVCLIGSIDIGPPGNQQHNQIISETGDWSGILLKLVSGA